MTVKIVFFPVSVRKGGKAVIGTEVIPVKFTPVEVIDKIIVDENRNTESNNNEPSGPLGWKNVLKRMNDLENKPKALEFEGPAKKFNIYLMLLKTFFTNKIKLKDLVEPPVLISVLKNSVLSDAVFFAILASRLDKMSLIPDKPFLLELISGVWLAYQVYMTWNNVIFYLLVVLLFAYDTNKWLKFWYVNHFYWIFM